LRERIKAWIGIEVSSDVMSKLVGMQPLRAEEAAEERVREGGGAIVTIDHKEKTHPTINNQHLLYSFI
jgi:hypothetical protein